MPPVCPREMSLGTLPKLTDDFLKSIKPVTGKRLEYRDDKEPGLIFRITDRGVKTWSVRYRNAAGEQRRKNLGGYPVIGLAKARELARQAKGTIAGGTDPVAVDKAARARERRKKLDTFDGLAMAYFAAARDGSIRGGPIAKPKREGTLAEEERIYSKLVKPQFGDRAVADITRADISDFVAKQGRKVKSNGRHCRNIIRQMMSFAVREGVRDHNPALDIAVAMPESGSEFCPMTSCARSGVPRCVRRTSKTSHCRGSWA